MKTTKRIFSILIVLCMLVGTIGVLPLSVFATGSCTCENRCYLNDIDENCTVCTNSDFSGCMGTPELVENGSPWRLSDAKAEVNFMATVNPNVTWKYFYIVTNDATAQPTASEIIAGGASGNYSDPYTLVLDNLAEGEKYIHIVLHQEEQNRTTNVLRLTIPTFEKLTIKPSANGGNYDAATNTLTIEGGGTVNFTLNMPGYVHCDSDETIAATPVGDDPENATEWTVTLPATPKTYTFYYGLGGQEAWCTVVVTEETHEHSYATTWSKDASGHWHECECGDKKDFATHTSSGAATVDAAEVCTVCGYEISPKLTIYTITPSAEGGSYDASTNTLTIVGGGTVNLTLNVSGTVRFYDNGEFTMTPVNGTADSATEWTTTLPNTNKTYHFYHNLSDLQAECIVIVKKAYTLTIDYSATLPDESLVGSGMADKTVVAPQGEVIDLSEYWPDELTYSLGGNTYYFGEFLENATGGNTVRSVTISDDLTVYAFWTTEKQITITFDPNGGSLPYEKVRENCCNISNMNRERQPTRSGCDFVGWSLENDGTADDGDIQLTEDCTLYAVWKVNSLSAPTGLRWDTSNGAVAVWDAVDGATHYIVELYKKDIISLRLFSHVISDTSFDFDLTSLLPGSYYFTVRATCDDVRSKGATSNDIIMTAGGTPILFNGSSGRVDYIDGTAFIVEREDIANGSISEIDMTPTTGTASLTEEQAKELIAELLASFVLDEEVFKSFVLSELADYSLDEIKLIRNNIRNDEIKKGILIDIIDEEIESREATALVIAPGYIDSTSAFKVTTGQGLGVTYSNDALRDLLTTVETGSNVKVATKFEKAEITRDEARIIVAEWAEIVNTTDGEELIKEALTDYSIYELALLQQYTKILVLDDSTAQKLYALVMVERDKKKEEAATKDNEEPLATFSVNTYAVAADGTQTYIPVKKSMQYAIPVDTSSIPENATLALYRVNEDGTRTKQEIISNENGLVIANTDGNSDYILVYELAEEHTHTFEWKIDKEATETEDGLKHEECACGAKQNENTVIPKTGTDDLVTTTETEIEIETETETEPKTAPEVPGGLSTGAIVAIVIVCVVVLAGGGFALYLFVFKKKKV